MKEFEQNEQVFAEQAGVQYIFVESGPYPTGQDETHWLFEKNLGRLLTVLEQGLHYLSTVSVENSGQVRHPLAEPSVQVRQE